MKTSDASVKARKISSGSRLPVKYQRIWKRSRKYHSGRGT
jgi:hypothetical protein